MPEPFVVSAIAADLPRGLAPLAAACQRAQPSERRNACQCDARGRTLRIDDARRERTVEGGAASERRTIAFFPEPGAWGPTNNCAAMAGVLRERGHRIVFVVDESFAGVLEARGFEERLFRMAPPDETPSGSRAADPWAEFIRVTAPEFRKPTIEQIATVTKPIWQALVEGEQYSHERVMAIWDEVRPDVVVTDNVTGYPAVELAGAPWVRVVSCNPLEMRDPDLPPALSGLPVADRSEWAAFRDEYHRVHADLLAEHNDFRRSVGVRPARPTNSTRPRRG